MLIGRCVECRSLITSNCVISPGLFKEKRTRERERVREEKEEYRENADEVVHTDGRASRGIIKTNDRRRTGDKSHCKFRKTSRSFPTIFVCNIKRRLMVARVRNS